MKGSTQHALARVAGIGERFGGLVPNSAEVRRKWGDGKGGVLTGRGMNCQGEINNEGKAGSRWPAAGLPRRDSDWLTSGLALAGATHWSPTSTLSHHWRVRRWIPNTTGWREAEITITSRQCLKKKYTVDKFGQRRSFRSRNWRTHTKTLTLYSWYLFYFVAHIT